MTQRTTKKLDLIGHRYGELIVLAAAGQTAAKKTKWLCRCDCGKEFVAVGGSLRSGHTTTCGCSYLRRPRNFKHGHSHRNGVKHFTKAYIVWAKMKSRCDNPNDVGYPDYGGRGISYDPRWKEFENFLADMGEPPVGRFIERIKNDKGYSKENCRWATRTEQARNKRNNLLIEYCGQTRTLAEWAEIYHIKYSKLYNRIVTNGWTPEEALKPE